MSNTSSTVSAIISSWTERRGKAMFAVGATQKRQRLVLLSLSIDRGVRRGEIRRLTPELAEMYAARNGS